MDEMYEKCMKEVEEFLDESKRQEREFIEAIELQQKINKDYENEKIKTGKTQFIIVLGDIQESPENYSV